MTIESPREPGGLGLSAYLRGQAAAEAELTRLRALVAELAAALDTANQWLHAAESAGKIGGSELEADTAKIRAALAKAKQVTP